MTSSFHINAKGNPGKCSAQSGNCPFGGDEQHFPTKEAAREFYELKQKIAAVPTMASVNKVRTRASEEDRRAPAIKNLQSEYEEVEAIEAQYYVDLIPKAQEQMEREGGLITDPFKTEDWVGRKKSQLNSAEGDLRGSRKSLGKAHREIAHDLYQRSLLELTMAERVNRDLNNIPLDEDYLAAVSNRVQHAKNIHALHLAREDWQMKNKLGKALNLSSETVDYVLNNAEDSVLGKKNSPRNVAYLSRNPGIIVKHSGSVSEEDVKEILKWVSHYELKDS